MATVREVVLPHDKKEDGTWNVKIRVTHQRRSVYIDTLHFVSAKQLKKGHRIKDAFIVDLVNPLLKDYRAKISELGTRLSFYDAKSLAYYLESGGQIQAEKIDVFKFGREQITRLEADGRYASAHDLSRVLNSLFDFWKKDFLPITEIRAKFLEDFEVFLKSPRVVIRLDQFKRPLPKNLEGIKKTGLHNLMRDLRILFNNIRDAYNDEDMGIVLVKHYPFKKYKIGKPAKNTKQKLTIKQVRSIMQCEVPENSRIELAKDLSMLSFFLCGMNSVDIYRLPPTKTNFDNRLNYNRKKTMERRDDEAFMSIKIPEISIPLYQKYVGKLQTRYTSPATLSHAISKGMVGLRKLTKIADLDFYDLRHAFADIARNDLHYSKDDVAEALNHVDQKNDVTDIYLSRSWEIIDEMQRDVIDYLTTSNKSMVKRSRNLPRDK